MSGLRSRNRGKRGERQLAAELRRIGFTDARRGVQFKGGPDSPDVVGVPGLHIESKFTETLSLYAALEQATGERDPLEIPIVVHRRSRKPWVIILHLDNIVGFAGRIYDALGYEVVKRQDTES